MLPRPHREVLNRLFDNPQLPQGDRVRFKEVFNRYRTWVEEISKLDPKRPDFISDAVSSLNDYKNFIDLDFTADGSIDTDGKVWLMRQKGQTKHSATIMEEFMPLIVSKLFPIPEGYSVGPATCILSLNIQQNSKGFVLDLNQKDVDFAIYRPLSVIGENYNVAALALELKDHVDKTMMSGTMRESSLYHQTFPSGYYGMVAGWRDLGPQAYQPLEGLDCFWLTRKARRMGHPRDDPVEVRKHWEANPYQPDVFEHLFDQISDFLGNVDEFEADFNCLATDISKLDKSKRLKKSHSTLDTRGWVR